MSWNKAALLREELGNLSKAAEHLLHSWQRSAVVLAEDDWDDAALERLESFASRFARLADLLTQRVLRLLDEMELEPTGSMLDRLYRAEKRDLLDNTADLVRIRELRNVIAHEYASDKLVEIYRAVAALTPLLLDIAARTAVYGDEALQRYSRLMGE